MSLTDLTEDAVEAPRLDLIGDAEVMDHTDFSGEADGVLDDELEREPNPDFACPATVTGAAAQAW